MNPNVFHAAATCTVCLKEEKLKDSTLAFYGTGNSNVLVLGETPESLEMSDLIALASEIAPNSDVSYTVRCRLNTMKADLKHDDVVEACSVYTNALLLRYKLVIDLDIAVSEFEDPVIDEMGVKYIKADPFMEDAVRARLRDAIKELLDG